MTIRQYGDSTEWVMTGRAMIWGVLFESDHGGVDQLIKFSLFGPGLCLFPKITSPREIGVISYSISMRSTVFYATSGVAGLEGRQAKTMPC